VRKPSDSPADFGEKQAEVFWNNPAEDVISFNNIFCRVVLYEE
jgi:hypothetical protein